MPENFNSLLDCLAMWVLEKPDAVAFRILQQDGIHMSEQITYKSLSDQAQQLAVELEQKFPPQSRIVLFYPTSIDFIIALFACFYAKMIAVPVYPPLPFSRRFFVNLAIMADIMADCSASCILTQKNARKLLALARLRLRLKRWLKLGDSRVCFSSESYHRITKTQVYDTPQLLKKSFRKNFKNSFLSSKNFANDSHIAYLQYTSGSTGKPKGVMVTHNNIINNSQNIAVIFPESLENYISWLPLYHDMGIMNGIFLPILLGVSSQLLSPMDFVANANNFLAFFCVRIQLALQSAIISAIMARFTKKRLEKGSGGYTGTAIILA